MTFRAFLALGLMLPTTALAASGGPDAYGWTWADNNSGGPAFDYVFAPNVGDISTNDGSFEATMPFSVDFYGFGVNTLRINANGALTAFSGTSLTGSNDCMSSTSEYLVAPFWDDLNITGGSIYYGTTGTAPNRVYIVEWYGVGHALSTGDLTFEVKIFEDDGHFEFHYQDVTLDSSTYSGGGSASVGLSGLDDLSRSCNTSVLNDSTAIGFYPPTGDVCEDNDGDGWSDCDGDCDDWNLDVAPDVSEICDGLDNNCDGTVPNNEFDWDSDSWTPCDGDCDDGDNGIYPGASEVCDGDDNDCDGTEDEGFDDDGDGWTTCDGDCDDTDEDINPGADEVPDNNADDDCDGEEWVTGDDDDATGDDDDDDDATDDDDDDDATGDDDDSAADDDDDDGGRSGGRSSRRGCNQAGPVGTAPLAMLGLLGLGITRRRGERA